MRDRDYKNCGGLSRIQAPSCPRKRASIAWIPTFVGMTIWASLAFAGPREDQITLATLKRVESIAKRGTSLEQFGKSTLQESAILLDLSAQAVPGLLKHLESRKGDWKARFWAVDMLGYVGDVSAVKPLREIASSRREKTLVRKRARRALKEISGRP